MFDSLLRYAIVIYGDLKTIGFYKDLRAVNNGETDGGKEISVETETYNVAAFSDEFYAVLKNMVKLHFGGASIKVALVLPDSVFFTDTFKVPVVKGKTESFVGVMIESVYKNSDELKIKPFLLAQGKQTATFGALGVKKDLIKNLRSAIEEDGVMIGEITAYSCAFAVGAAVLNPKIKNADCLLLDVKEDATRYIYQIGGQTVGFYAMPIGTKHFKRDGVCAEYNLFDHTAAEEVVYKAEEKAKRKNFAAAESAAGGSAIKQNRAKKAPKLTLSAKPETEEDYVYENFRIIVKYALELIRSNPELTAVEKPKTVYMNIAEEYKFIFDRLKEEGIAIDFEPMFNDKASEEVMASITAFGGFYLKKYNKSSNI